MARARLDLHLNTVPLGCLDSEIGTDIGMYTIWINMTQSSKEDIRIASLL